MQESEKMTLSGNNFDQIITNHMEVGKMTTRKDASIQNTDNVVDFKVNPTQILTIQVANCPNIDSEIPPVRTLLSLYGTNKLERVFTVGEDFEGPNLLSWFQKEIGISIMKVLKENGMDKGWYFVQGKGMKYRLKRGEYDHFWLEYEDWEIVFPDHIQYIRNEKHLRISVSNTGYYLSDNSSEMVQRICFPRLQKLIDRIEKENYNPGNGFEQILGTLED
jgi:hypothetical protein